MVAPLIVGASRIVAGGSKVLKPAMRGGRKAKSRAEIAKSARNRAEIEVYSELIQNEEDLEKQAFYQRSKKHVQNFHTLKKLNQRSKFSLALKGVKTIRAAVASSFIFWTAIPFWVPQIAFWLVGLAGLGFESIPFANYILPGQTLFTFSYLIILFIGITTMIYALCIYAIRKINFFSGMKGLVFAICIALYCAPFLNFAPWFIGWLWIVTKNQGSDESPEENTKSA